MLRRVAIAARPLSRRALPRPQLIQIRNVSADMSGAPEVKLAPNVRYEPIPSEMSDDPRMNGDYPELPPLKRQLRDPYDDYWDKQQRRNYGEPVHEDNDIMGIFSTYVYDHFTVKWSWVLFGTFVTTFVGFCGVVSLYYPDKPSVKRRFEEGLDKELGGPGSLPALKIGEES